MQDNFQMLDDEYIELKELTMYKDAWNEQWHRLVDEIWDHTSDQEKFIPRVETAAEITKHLKKLEAEKLDEVHDLERANINEEMIDRFYSSAEEFLGWKSHMYQDHGETLLTIENHSPSGELIRIKLHARDLFSYNTLTNRLHEEALKFDPEEYAADRYRSESGQSLGLRDLLADADEIQNMLDTLEKRARQDLLEFKPLDVNGYSMRM